MGFFKAKNHAYLNASGDNKTDLIEINSPGDEVFDKEQALLDEDIQNPLIKDESIDFPKAESEEIIENNDYINPTNAWSVFNTAQRELGDLHHFNWKTKKMVDNSFYY